MSSAARAGAAEPAGRGVNGRAGARGPGAGEARRGRARGGAGRAGRAEGAGGAAREGRTDECKGVCA